MPSNTSQAFGTGGSFTITMASLASSATAGRESTALDIASLGNVIDVEVQVICETAAGTIANDQAVYVNFSGTADGTNWPKAGANAVTGTDAAITVTNIDLGISKTIATPTASTVYISNPISLLSFFGGSLPKKVSAIVRNYSGVALSATAGNNKIVYTPIYYTASLS